ncbi:MAG: T9SS type A sorting domain-containing protein [Crocinitomicaceae bacterium]
MRLVFFISTSLLAFFTFGQNDTLRLSNPKAIADTIFGRLDTTGWNGSLLNRSLTESEIILDQMYGDYSQVHTAYTFFDVYPSISLSYLDSSKMFNSRELIEKINEFYYQSELNSDEYEVPFALLYHNLSYIDSSDFNSDNFSVMDGQLVANSTLSNLINTGLFKSCAILELYDDSGYPEGKIVYDPKFISTSDDIVLNNIEIDVGNGFEELSSGSDVYFSRNIDSAKAVVRISFYQDGELKTDLIRMYITKTVNSTAKSGGNRAQDRWDEKYTQDFNADTDLKYRVGIKYGCGNGGKIRRPVIFVPPYRPLLQSVSMDKYYDQFNIRGLFDDLTDLGYDVIFIKQKPGNRSIKENGVELSFFIKSINQLKKYNFPNEDWENVLIGFSAGGQHARYALMYMEKDHMDNGGEHHHTRLYIPFDSPTHGASVPYMAQSVYYEMDRTWNLWAALSYDALTDPASKSMLINNIASSNIQSTGTNEFTIHPSPTTERVDLQNELDNSFVHAYTNTGPNDMRFNLPSFSRNVSISTGRFDVNYTNEYQLNPGHHVFHKFATNPTWFGWVVRERDLYSSKYDYSANNFYRKDIRMVALLIPIITQRRYKTRFLPEFDQAQGGYKNEFYDKWGNGIVPISPIPILQLQSFGLGNHKYYHNNVSFMPIVSALGINPNIWSNNQLSFNLHNYRMMFKSKAEEQFGVQNEYFGYPHLGNPSNHFEITPYEAVYADQQTYEHIKIEETSLPGNDHFMDSIRNFIIREIEGNNVELQNKVIGENHTVSIPNYRYKAWYKAKDTIKIGSNVTDKTNYNEFGIKESGDITTHAGKEVYIGNGFHVESGAYWHAYVYWDGCNIQRSTIADNEGGRSDNLEDYHNDFHGSNEATINHSSEFSNMKVFPNPSKGEFTIELDQGFKDIIIEVRDLLGKLVYTSNNSGRIHSVNTNLKGGIYFVHCIVQGKVRTKKIVLE